MKVINKLCVCLAVLILSSALLPQSVCAEESKEYRRAYILMELTTGTVIEGQLQDAPVPVGTMNKLMTVLLAAESIADGKLSEDTLIKTSAYAGSVRGASIWLAPGEEMTVRDILKGIIIGNANDASAAAAEAAAGSEKEFVSLMNRRAKELGMENTSFSNCCGYYDDEMQVSTARDMAVLCGELYRHSFLKEYFTCWRDELRGGATELVNSNVLVKSYDGIIGFKAGYAESSGNCIAAAAERNGAVFAAVLLGYDDKDSMFYDAKQLLNRGFSGYQVIRPVLPEDAPDSVPVKKSMTRVIPVGYSEINSIVIPVGTLSSVSAAAVFPEYVYAPVKKGDKIGEVLFYRNDKFIFSADIIAEGTAEKTGIKSLIVILLKNIFVF